jgi:hypothetical protein
MRVTYKDAIEIAKNTRKRLDDALALEVTKEAVALTVLDEDGDYFDEVSCLETGD